MKYFLLISFLLFFHITLLGQSPAYVNYTTEDGLLTNTIYCSHQDSLGYMWFGTAAGVSRFNGKSFSHFLNDSEEKQRDIYSIVDGPDGEMWFVGGKKVWYWEDGEVKEWEFNGLLEEHYNVPMIKPIKQFQIDSKNNLHFFIYHYKHITLSSKGIIKNIQKNTNTLIQIDSIWFPLHQKSSKKNNKKYFYDFSFNKRTDTIAVDYSISHIRLNSINFEDQPIFSLTNTLIYVKKNKSIIKKFDDEIKDLYLSDNKSIYFILLKKGIIKLNLRFKELPHDFHALDQYLIKNIFQDKNSKFWFTTLYNGIFYYPNQNVFNYKTKGAITSINKFDEKIIIGEHNGGIFYLTENKKFIPNKNISTRLKSFFLINDDLYCNNRRFNIINPNKEIITNSLKTHKTFIFKDEIICSSYSNIHIYNKTENSFSNYCSLDSLTFRDKTSKIFDIELFKDGTLIVACLNGLKLINQKTITDLKIIENKIPNDLIVDIEKYDNSFFFGTKKNGVLIWDMKSIKNLNINNGLQSNQITILKVRKNILWIGTNKGLHIHNLKNNSTTTFTKDMGLINNNIKSLFFNNNYVYIGTSMGVSKLPLSLIDNPIIYPDIYLRKLITKDSLFNFKKEHILNYQNNDLTFIIDILNFNKTSNKNVQFRLKGHTESWENIEEEVVRLLSIPNGKYVFEISYLNNDGYRIIPISYSFEIKPPFWKTTVFFVISIISILVIIILLFKQYLNRRRKKQIRNSKLLTSQQQTISAKMDPHFLFNSLNSIQYFITFDKNKVASKYLVKFTKLMRQHLTYTENEFVVIKSEIELINSYCNLEQIRFENDFDYSINIGVGVDVNEMTIPISIVQPAIENAILHGLLPKLGKKILTISFQINNGSIILTIQDNGVGRIQSKINKVTKSITKQSYAHNLIIKKLKLLSSIESREYSMTILDLQENGKPIGTKVKYILPINYLKNTTKKRKNKRIQILT